MSCITANVASIESPWVHPGVSGFLMRCPELSAALVNHWSTTSRQFESYHNRFAIVGRHEDQSILSVRSVSPNRWLCQYTEPLLVCRGRCCISCMPSLSKILISGSLAEGYAVETDSQPIGIRTVLNPAALIFWKSCRETQLSQCLRRMSRAFGTFSHSVHSSTTEPFCA